MVKHQEVSLATALGRFEGSLRTRGIVRSALVSLLSLDIKVTPVVISGIEVKRGNANSGSLAPRPAIVKEGTVDPKAE